MRVPIQQLKSTELRPALNRKKYNTIQHTDIYKCCMSKIMKKQTLLLLHLLLKPHPGEDAASQSSGSVGSQPQVQSFYKKVTTCHWDTAATHDLGKRSVQNGPFCYERNQLPVWVEHTAPKASKKLHVKLCARDSDVQRGEKKSTGHQGPLLERLTNI